MFSLRLNDNIVEQKFVAMNKFVFTLCFMLLALGAISQTSIGRIYFEKDKSKVVLSEIEALNAKLKQLQFDTLFIQGRADIDGNNEYNYALSKRRVEAVKNALILPANTVVIESLLGESNPINNQSDEVEKSLNRFVELAYQPKLINDPETILELISRDFHEKLQIHSTIYDSSEIQNISGKTNNDIQFVGKKGTQVQIPAGFLLNENGEAFSNEDVEIRFVEIRTIADMILFNATTQSDSQLLETGGMIFLQAYVDGKPVKKFNNEKSATITFKGTPEKMKNMQLFVGDDPNHLHSDERTNSGRQSRKGVNWTPVGGPLTPNNDSIWEKAYSPISYNISPRFLKRQNAFFAGVMNWRLRRNLNMSYKNKYYNQSLELENTKEKIEGSSWTLPDSFQTNKNSSSGPDLGVGLKVQSLGWINCDRFLNSNYRLTNVKVSKAKGSSFAILPEFNSIMQPFDNSFKNLPVGKRITVISFLVVKDRVLFKQEFGTIQNNLNFDMSQPADLSLEEFRAILKSMI